MKTFLLILSLFIAVPIHAQDGPINGYEKLLEAGNLILPGENGSPSANVEKLLPAENLRRQRLAVARNAPALQMLRKALEMPIKAPIPQSYEGLDLTQSVKLRELGRQLRQESDVRAADGDYAGALDSRLTSIELGVAMMQGRDILGILESGSVESIARKGFGEIASHLDATALHKALERLKSIDARRPTMAEVTEVDMKTAINLSLLIFKDEATLKIMREKMATEEGRKEMRLTDSQAAEILVMTPESVTKQIQAAFEAVVSRDKLPYKQAKEVVFPPAKGMYSQMWLSNVKSIDTRFTYERALAEARLFTSALELFIIKSEKGAYPSEFQAPTDPFGDGAPLIYHREGEGYSLYSVGPDGKDDDGAEIETLETNRVTGAKSVTGYLRSTSLGDIMAPIL